MNYLDLEWDRSIEQECPAGTKVWIEEVIARRPVRRSASVIRAGFEMCDQGIVEWVELMLDGSEVQNIRRFENFEGVYYSIDGVYRIYGTYIPDPAENPLLLN